MCQYIVLDGEHIETIGQARAAFGAAVTFDLTQEEAATNTDDECLCWLDMEATAERAGYVATNQHGGDPAAWHFAK